VPGRLDDAAAELKEALRLRPDFAPGWHVLGVVSMRLGNLQEAAAAFHQELRLSPDNPAALEALAAVAQQAEGR
jgi:cytochrome c-type biogenesis protein CcmH/NrfG